MNTEQIMAMLCLDSDLQQAVLAQLLRLHPPTTPAQQPLTRSEKNRIWSSCSDATTLSARASLFGTKIEAHIKGASL